MSSQNRRRHQLVDRLDSKIICSKFWMTDKTFTVLNKLGQAVRFESFQAIDQRIVKGMITTYVDFSYSRNLYRLTCSHIIAPGHGGNTWVNIEALPACGITVKFTYKRFREIDIIACLKQLYSSGSSKRTRAYQSRRERKKANIERCRAKYKESQQV